MATLPQIEQEIVSDPQEEETVKKLLKDLGERFENDDKQAHDYYRRRGRKAELYWNYIQDIFWSEVNGDFRLISERFDDIDDDEFEEYNTTINIFRAYGESIIAAAAAGLPHVRFFPSDADNPDDILAARASSKLSELISHHNEAQFLFVHALYILYTQTLLGIYNYNKSDESYGTIAQPKYELQNIENTYNVCPECGFETQDESIQTCPECEATELNADPNTITPLEPNQPVSPQLVPEVRQEEQIQQTGVDFVPKTREILEVYGTANLKVAHYVKNPKNTPYLILETDQHVSLLRELYPNFYDQLTPQISDPENFRKPADGFFADAVGLVTCKYYWLRPWSFNYLSREESALLKSKYPDGVCVVKINDIIVECRPEKLDDHWNLYRDPLSSHINTQPMGQGVIPIQDMRNDCVYLSLDTIKHGVGETFVDSDVINWDTYSKHRNKAGMVVPVNRKRKDMGLDSSFYASKTANLSKEVNDFFFLLSRDGEFMSRAMPSIFGGTEQGGSQTLGEHESKRNQALQRLSLPWKALNILYAQSMENAVKEFVENMLEDERQVKKLGTSYVNVWMRRAELQGGKTGQVVSETAEQFPLTWLQKKDLLIQMLGMQKEPIDATLFHPENVTTVAQIFGMPDLHIPGEDDRNKQLIEILELIQSQPIPGPPQVGIDGMPMIGPDGQPIPGPMQPSVPIEPEVDNAEIHIEVIRAWCNSDEGQEVKKTNPAGYQNVIAHLQAHLMAMAPPVAPQQEEQMPPEFNEEAQK